MKKLISCLLVVVMLFTAAAAFAESDVQESDKSSYMLNKFLDETDMQKQDLAVQVQDGDQNTDLVIHFDRETIHLVTRNNEKEDAHIQINPTGVYIGANGNVVLLRYATVTTLEQDIAKAVTSMLEEAEKNIPADKLPTQTEVNNAVSKLAEAASAVAVQEQADAVTLSSVATAYASKFDPEKIIDVKEEDGSVKISLRSDTFATALAEAQDEMMKNPALAELVNRQAAANGGSTFAEIQREWADNRETVLESIRTIQDTDVIDENGHWVSHFQIGKENSGEKVLVLDVDAWIDAEEDTAEIKTSMGLKDEDPMMVHELSLAPDSYRDKLSAGESFTEIQMNFDDNRIDRGEIFTVIEGKEEMRAYFSPDYVYMKGPKGSISTSARETWTGKTRYELEVENADGASSYMIIDFYQDGDSLVCELSTSDSDQPAIFRISRIDRMNLEDLSASANINEITVELIEGEMEKILKPFIKTDK